MNLSNNIYEKKIFNRRLSSNIYKKDVIFQVIY